MLRLHLIPAACKWVATALRSVGYTWLGAERRLWGRKPLRSLGSPDHPVVSMVSSSRRHGRLSVAVVLVLATAAAVLAFGLALANLRQITSEIGRVWLICGAAWFFFLRAGPLTERLARSGKAATSFLRYAWPMLFVVAVLVGAMFVTRDMGPLLIAGYASARSSPPHWRCGGITAAAGDQRSRSRSSSSPAGSAPSRSRSFASAPTTASIGEPARERRRAVRVDQRPARARVVVPAPPRLPRASASAPRRGAASRRRAAAAACRRRSTATTPSRRSSACSGLVAWAASLAMAIWLHRPIRHHGRVTRGEPRSSAPAASSATTVRRCSAGSRSPGSC